MISKYIIVVKGGKSQHKVEQNMQDGFREQNYYKLYWKQNLNFNFFLLLLYNPINGDEQEIQIKQQQQQYFILKCVLFYTLY